MDLFAETLKTFLSKDAYTSFPIKHIQELSPDKSINGRVKCDDIRHDPSRFHLVHDVHDPTQPALTAVTLQKHAERHRPFDK